MRNGQSYTLFIFDFLTDLPLTSVPVSHPLSCSPDKMCRGIMSESSDSDDESNNHTTTRSPPKIPSKVNTSVSDNSDDIFNINYKGKSDSDSGFREDRSGGKKKNGPSKSIALSLWSPLQTAGIMLVEFLFPPTQGIII